MNIATFIILSLAVWRLASFLANDERGPFALFDYIRRIAGNGELGEIISCTWCLSVYLGFIVFAAWYAYPLPTMIVCIPFALSAMAILADRVSNG